VSPLVVAALSFAAMEVVSYAAHRWVMHGFAMLWHGSHHRPPRNRFEKNDLFPLCFSAVGVGTFAAGTSGPAVASLFWVALGITLYGAVYLFVHEVYIHGRLPVPVPRLAYLEWLRESHRIHHLFGGEPYGMLLPLVSRSQRERAARSAAGGPDRSLDRAVEVLDRRRTRPARMRL
jgi:beta-carotene 3-hydroxylase